MPTKTTYTYAWDAGARTIATLNESGYFQFYVGQSVGIVCGLNNFDLNASYRELEHAFWIEGFEYRIIENGVFKTSLTSYSSGDPFKIERIDNTVKYYVNNSLVYTSSTPSTGVVFLDCSLYAFNDTVINPSVVNYAAVIEGTIISDGGASVDLFPITAKAVEGTDVTYVGVNLSPVTVTITEQDTQTVVANLSSIKAKAVEGANTTLVEAYLSPLTVSLEETLLVPDITTVYADLSPLVAKIVDYGGPDSLAINLSPIKSLAVEGTSDFVAVDLLPIDVSMYEGYSNYIAFEFPALTAFRPIGIEITFPIETPLGIEHVFPISTGIDSEIELTTPFLSDIGIEHEITATLNQYYLASTEYEAITPIQLGIEFEMPAELVTLTSISIEHEFTADLEPRDLIPISTEFEIPIQLSTKVQTESEFVIPFTTAIGVEWSSVYDLSARYYLKSEYRIVYSLEGAAAAYINDIPPLQTATRTIPITEGEVVYDEGNFVWQGTFTLINVEDYSTLKFNDAFTFTIQGETYQFIVDGKSMDRQNPAQITLKIDAVSPTAIHGFPRASPFTKTWETEVYAKDAAEEALGISINWNVVNWKLPAYRFAVENVAPIEVVELLATAVGGVIDTAPDGTLSVRPIYPITTEFRYENVIPDHVLTELVDIFALSEQLESGRLVNKIRIFDADAAYTDTLEWIVDEGDGTRGVLRAFPGPYREPIYAPVVTTSLPSVVTLSALYPTVKTEIIRGDDEGGELIEIVDGKGSTRYPIYGIVDVFWESETVSGLSFVAGGSEVFTSDPSKKYGLLKLTYTTKFHQYRVIGTKDRNAQFLMGDEREVV